MDNRSDLEVEMEARLHNVYLEKAPTQYLSLDGANAMARECLRQMEWARSRLIAREDSNGTRFYVDGNWGTPWHTKPLTLAPEDWKP